ncbi:hypothetical protein [Vibrio ziniensis]|uniref:YtxH domain-containing protein n=1 Tax=Vibrio ziniensis TaxID=2711221 RepID=A0A6G7CLX9_9VIBR|nr:hypothetical protein [Vibrio ziniensis]QIH43053.1 hypothetical protein G5S32_14350 [Vibrio ziniensis]
MLRLIALFLVIAGIYIGVQYRDEILDLFGQSSFDQVEDAIKDGKDAVADKLQSLKG